MVLLDVLSRLAPLYRLRLVACYVHHGIRPAADAEVDFVRQEALRRRCGFTWQYVDVPTLARREKNVGRSCRTAGTLPNFTHDEAGLWGHDDCRRPSRRRSAETVLLHLLRGSGLQGLCGMEPRRGDIIRPLLGFTKAELAAYAKAQGIPSCHDETNDSTRYHRNRIRLELLPSLMRYNPAITATSTAWPIRSVPTKLF